MDLDVRTSSWPAGPPSFEKTSSTCCRPRLPSSLGFGSKPQAARTEVSKSPFTSPIPTSLPPIFRWIVAYQAMRGDSLPLFHPRKQRFPWVLALPDHAVLITSPIPHSKPPNFPGLVAYQAMRSGIAKMEGRFFFPSISSHRGDSSPTSTAPRRRVGFSGQRNLGKPLNLNGASSAKKEGRFSGTWRAV